jgi:hypothetical protein
MRTSILAILRSLGATAFALLLIPALGLAGILVWFATFLAAAVLTTVLPSELDGIVAIVGVIGGLVLAAVVIVIGYRRFVAPALAADEVDQARPMPAQGTSATFRSRLAAADARHAEGAEGGERAEDPPR